MTTFKHISEHIIEMKIEQLKKRVQIWGRTSSGEKMYITQSNNGEISYFITAESQYIYKVGEVWNRWNEDVKIIAAFTHVELMVS